VAKVGHPQSPDLRRMIGQALRDAGSAP
jgi:hypothetical protein